MNVAVGNRIYSYGSVDNSAFGTVWTDEDLDAALSDRLGAALSDSDRTSEVESTLSGLAETEFQATGVRRILASSEQLKNWQVGETFSIVYLEDHHRCEFPWPTGRDSRKDGSSLPGADLVGFTSDAHGCCYAFGETKTSSEMTYPPRVIHGDDGLISQLKALRDNQSIRDGLVRYLLFKASSSSWHSRYQAAAKRYISDSTDVTIYGVLIRDVEPNPKDLHGPHQTLGKETPARTRLRLIAIYLPVESLSDIGARVVSRKANHES